jgi:hypothetical protein
MARVWHLSPFRRTTEVHATLRRYLHFRRHGSDLAPGSHDRLEAREPGSRKPVKAASRGSRARAARALTGLRRAGSGSRQAIMDRRSRRGARISDFVQPCAMSQTASQKRTSLQQADAIAFFHSPTGAHIAPFILPSSVGGLLPAVAARSSDKLRLDKNGPGTRQQIPRKFIAADSTNLWSPRVRHVLLAHAKPGRRSCGAAVPVRNPLTERWPGAVGPWPHIESQELWRVRSYSHS